MTKVESDMWHWPQPGPLYWDWRCVVCGEDVARHPPLWKRWKHGRETRRSDASS